MYMDITDTCTNGVRDISAASNKERKSAFAKRKYENRRERRHNSAIDQKAKARNTEMKSNLNYDYIKNSIFYLSITTPEKKYCQKKESEARR